METVYASSTRHVSVFVWKWRFFGSGLAYRPHAFGENGHRKRIFSKTLSREEIFENAANRLRMEGRKRRFRIQWCHKLYTNYITDAPWGMRAFSCGGGTGGGGPFRIRNYGRVFFQKPMTKFSVFKNMWIRVDGAWNDDRIVISIKKYIPKMWCKTIQSFFFAY